MSDLGTYACLGAVWLRMSEQQVVVLRGVRAGDIFPRDVEPGNRGGYCTVVRLPGGIAENSHVACVNEDELCARMQSVAVGARGLATELIPAQVVDELRKIWSGDLKHEDLVIAGVIPTKDLSMLRFHVLVPWITKDREYVYFVYSEKEGLMVPLVLVKGSGGPHWRCVYKFQSKEYK